MTAGCRQAAGLSHWLSCCSPSSHWQMLFQFLNVNQMALPSFCYFGMEPIFISMMSFDLAPPLPRLNCYCTDGYCIIVNNEQNFLCFRFSQVANHYHCFAAFTQNVYCSCLCIWVKEYLFRNAGWKSTSRAEALAVKRPVCTVNAPSSHQAPGLRER